MEPLSTVSTGRYAELDLLRFLASLAVVLLHFTYSMPLVAHIGPAFPLLGSIFRYGYLAVDLFLGMIYLCNPNLFRTFTI